MLSIEQFNFVANLVENFKDEIHEHYKGCYFSFVQDFLDEQRDNNELTLFNANILCELNLMLIVQKNNDAIYSPLKNVQQ